MIQEDHSLLGTIPTGDSRRLCVLGCSNGPATQPERTSLRTNCLPRRLGSPWFLIPPELNFKPETLQILTCRPLTKLRHTRYCVGRKPEIRKKVLYKKGS